MTTVAEMRRRWQDIDLVEETTNAMEKENQSIVDFNRAQLFAGEYTNEKLISPRYQNATVQYKISKGQPYDRVTLEDNGSFYRAMYLRITGDSFEITSSDPKTSSLEDKYTGRGEIFGLNDENKARAWAEFLKGDVVISIAQQTGATYE